ncbi:MAG: hypothetical protein IH822_10795 [Chloroflexi bacterium]|nr:hypothetical protein [Chloroflexota bacterium]
MPTTYNTNPPAATFAAPSQRASAGVTARAISAPIAAGATTNTTFSVSMSSTSSV